jgi:hypothetical protein
MKKLVLLFFTLTLLTGSCDKIEDCPECIRNKVKEFAKNRICNDGSAGVAEYLFQNQYVYVFSDGTCGADLGAAVYSQNCEYLGYLGGITGNLNINGVRFHEVAIFQKKIWQD